MVFCTLPVTHTELSPLCCVQVKAFQGRNMNSSGNYWTRFIGYREKYPLTVSLFRKMKFKEAFEEIADVVKELSRKYSSSDLKVHLEEILLNRHELRLKNWTPIHHAFFGAVFELSMYKDRDPFLLDKCERYQSFLLDKLGNNKKGVRALRKDLGNCENFQKGIFFEMEADVLLAKITDPPQELRKKLKGNSDKDVDFVGSWNGKALNFEIKSLTESPKYLAKGCEQIDGIAVGSVGWEIFLQDRRKRIKDILAYEAIKKFEPGANNFVVMPDADRSHTESEQLKCTIRDLVADDLGISEKILAVIMYQTVLTDEKPANRRAIMAKVGDCPSWVDDFVKAFRSAEA